MKLQYSATIFAFEHCGGKNRICLSRVRLCLHLMGSWIAGDKEKTGYSYCACSFVFGYKWWRVRGIGGGGYRLNAAASLFFFSCFGIFFLFLALPP